MNYVGAERKRQERRQEGRGAAGSKVDGLDPPQGLCLHSVTIVGATQALVQRRDKVRLNIFVQQKHHLIKTRCAH